ncbi:MAG: hypothetical protein KBF24_11015 [Thiobacillaceae bacterium]|jgi:hypothetical protein|nr:hypothetical protein [Thiobacillaceae bacterium]MBP9916729.1 hypothetical protein [Thiobacillaceae bacterium]
MKTTRIAKILSTAALVSLGLMAGTSQADNYGFYAHVNAPAFDRHGPGPAFGHGYGYGPQWGVSHSIDQRQRAMMARIEHGIRTGQLTRYEANDLVKDLRRTELLERRFESDGRLGRGEAIELDRLLDRLGRELREDLHDDDRRGGRHAWR